MKKIQYFLVALLSVSSHYMQSAAFYRSPKKIIASGIALGAAGLGGQYGLDEYTTHIQYQQTQQTFRDLGIRHINHVESRYPSIIPTTQKYHRVIDQIIKNQEEGMIHHGLYTAAELAKIRKQVQRADLGLRKDLKLAYINENKGHGVIATKEVPVNSVVGIYAGEVCHCSQVQDPTYTFTSLHVYEAGTIYGRTKLVGLEMQIDAKHAGNITRFINAPGAQEDPNCFVVNMLDENKNPQVVYVANRSIKPGEELTIDYGPRYVWKNDRE
jgi:hypothetical protein